MGRPSRLSLPFQGSAAGYQDEPRLNRASSGTLQALLTPRQASASLTDKETHPVKVRLHISLTACCSHRPQVLNDFCTIWHLHQEHVQSQSCGSAIRRDAHRLVASPA